MSQLQSQQPSVAPKTRDEKLWKACVQFEALFTQQMLAAMHKTVPDSGFLPNGFAQGVHNDMFNQAVAESMANGGHAGIATALYRQIDQLGQPRATQENRADADNQQEVSDFASKGGVTDGTH